MAEQALATETAPAPDLIPRERRFTQVLLFGVCAACFVIFWRASLLLGVPAEPRHGGSLLAQPTIGIAIIGLLGAIVLLAGCTVLATAVLERRWIFGGLTAATIGLSAWAMRGGPMHDVLFYASSAMIFARMTVELLILGGAVAFLWVWIWTRHHGGGAPNPAVPVAPGTAPEKSGDVMTAVGVQTLVMGVVVVLLAQTDWRKQAVASVFIAAVTGTGVAEAYFSGRHTPKWYWAGPLIVGVFGYLSAIFFNYSAWQSGTRELAGPFAALARALPLDYASAGMCGALFGYGWMTADTGEPEPSPGAKSN